jgi:hypothetical protein
MSKWFFNPFFYIAGYKALFIGLCGLLISSFLCYCTDISYYNICVFPSIKYPLVYFIARGVILWIFMALLSYLSGFAFSKSSIRIIDVIGTQALARLPMVILPLPFFIPSISQHFFYTVNLGSLSIISTIGFVYVNLLFIWQMVLLFNAYKISCNLKDMRLIFSFILIILMSEILTRYFIYQAYNFLFFHL